MFFRLLQDYLFLGVISIPLFLKKELNLCAKDPIGILSTKKSEIEKIVRELLSVGSIRDNNSY